MTKIEELRQKLASFKEKGRALLKKAEDENRDLTDAEADAADRIKADVANVQAAIVAEERRLEAARSFEDAAGTPTARPVPAGAIDRDEEARGGFRNTADFAVAVRTASLPGGHTDERLARLYRPGAAPANFHQEAGGSAGEGYLVPPAMSQRIWENTFNQPDLLSLSNPLPTGSREVKGIGDESTPWGSSGIQANWRAEGSQMSASKIATKPRSTTLHELYAYVLATGEMLDDAPLLNSRIESGAARAISWKASDAIMWGNGVGKPMGFMNSAALVTVAKESGQAADTIVAANLLKMLSRLLMTPGARPFWIANSQTIPQLATMTIGNQPMWIPAGQIDQPIRGTLLGYPVVYSEHCTALGDLGDIALVDFNGYESYRRSSAPEAASSIHLYFDYNIEAFRWIFRFGGQPYLSAPVAGAKANVDTKSHFVTLAARA